METAESLPIPQLRSLSLLLTQDEGKTTEELLTYLICKRDPMLGYMNENTIVGEERVGAKKFFSLSRNSCTFLAQHTAQHSTQQRQRRVRSNQSDDYSFSPKKKYQPCCVNICYNGSNAIINKPGSCGPII